MLGLRSSSIGSIDPPDEVISAYPFPSNAIRASTPRCRQIELRPASKPADILRPRGCRAAAKVHHSLSPRRYLEVHLSDLFVCPKVLSA